MTKPPEIPICHPERRYGAFGLCKPCKGKLRNSGMPPIPHKRDRSDKTPSKCHPTRMNYIEGSCKQCYYRDVFVPSFQAALALSVEIKKTKKARMATCHPDRPHLARGLCKNCYANWHNYMERGLPKTKGPETCFVEGCGRSTAKGGSVKRGLCATHDYRFRKTGTTDKKLFNLEEVGNIYGSWTIVEKILPGDVGGVVTKYSRFRCRCECGTEKTLLLGNIRSGRSSSCGCKLKLATGVANRNHLLSTYIHSAWVRGHEWSLTEEMFDDLVKSDCFYCAAPPSAIKKHPAKNGDFIYSGIDRKDNFGGYTVDNVVPCCGRCNRAKHVVNIDDFLAWVSQVYNHCVLPRVQMWHSDTQ